MVLLLGLCGDTSLPQEKSWDPCRIKIKIKENPVAPYPLVHMSRSGSDTWCSIFPGKRSARPLSALSATTDILAPEMLQTQEDIRDSVKKCSVPVMSTSVTTIITEAVSISHYPLSLPWHVTSWYHLWFYACLLVTSGFFSLYVVWLGAEEKLLIN
ncbi:hypothetical protein E2C01_022550 [Portunus trituberculatus]|uniref:Uncharacterized protein n=1 Tax=Portunus trituberculatus TaxID=210409 RepID=A0A5B7E5M7_PORTR|nr:hypothetical protein [Portunus trituberculatus]